MRETRKGGYPQHVGPRMSAHDRRCIPLCTARDSRCTRKACERGSRESVEARAPMSLQSSVAEVPQVPNFSIATGMNKMDPDRTSSVYLAGLSCSACFAAEPTVEDDWPTCDGATVSEHVK